MLGLKICYICLLDQRHSSHQKVVLRVASHNFKYLNRFLSFREEGDTVTAFPLARAKSFGTIYPNRDQKFSFDRKDVRQTQQTIWETRNVRLNMEL